MKIRSGFVSNSSSSSFIIQWKCKYLADKEKLGYVIFRLFNLDFDYNYDPKTDTISKKTGCEDCESKCEQSYEKYTPLGLLADFEDLYTEKHNNDIFQNIIRMTKHITDGEYRTEINTSMDNEEINDFGEELKYLVTAFAMDKARHSNNFEVLDSHIEEIF